MINEEIKLPKEPIQILLTLNNDGIYETDVWINGEYIGGGAAMGGFIGAFDQSQDVLWEFDREIEFLNEEV